MDRFLAFSLRMKEAVHSILGWIASAMLLGLTLFALLEIIRRYIFGVVFEWGQDAIIARIVVSTIIMLFCGSVGVTGWSTLSYAWDRNLTTYSLLIPLWPFYLILIFGFLLMAFIAFLQMVEDIISFSRREYLDAKIESTTDI